MHAYVYACPFCKHTPTASHPPADPATHPPNPPAHPPTLLTPLLQVVAAYNADPAVHGILVQLPLPRHIDEQRVLDAISIEKDVDGFHPLNIGRLAMRGRDPLFVPCTPKGCLELLKRSGVTLAGKKAAVVGRSNIVGMPAALLLQREDATVTVIHSRTPDAQRICAEADIIIAACGRAEMVGGDWVKEGAAVIDVGINAVDVSTAWWQPAGVQYSLAACCCCWHHTLACRLPACMPCLPPRILASLPAQLPAYHLPPLPASPACLPCLPPLPASPACLPCLGCLPCPAGPLRQARLPPGGRRQLCRGVREGGLHHPRPRRRGPHDHCHVAAQLRGRRGAHLCRGAAVADWPGTAHLGGSSSALNSAHIERVHELWHRQRRRLGMPKGVAEPYSPRTTQPCPVSFFV